MNLEVNTFSLGSDKGAALKPLEEAAEVFAAWQRLYDAQIEYGYVGVDGDYTNEFEAFSRYESERRSLAYEIADCLTALCNLAARFGLDVQGAVVEVERRNRERGRYD